MPRSIWTGSISFGLVTIPVRVYSAIRQHDVRFHQVTAKGARVRIQRVTEAGRKVEFEDIKKGYETGKGKWVIFEPDELDKLVPPSTKTIEIEDFVALEEIDPIYYERTYHLAPANDAAARSYALLASVMADRGRVGIGKVVMRDKQYLAAIRPFGKGLAMSTMLFADEVVPQSDIDAVPARKPSVASREKEMAGQILDSLAREWDPKRYHDDYAEQLQSLIRAKAKGKAVAAAEPQESAKVLDLMDALRASLDSGSRKPKRRAAKTTSKRVAKRRSPAKRRSA